MNRQTTRPLVNVRAVLAAVALCGPAPFGAGAHAQTEVRWVDAKSLGVEGKGWTETSEFFDRLPAKAEGVVRPPVWNLSRQSAGLSVRFVSDAGSVQARWSVTSKNLAMPHMPATGVSGLDLYVRDGEGRWRWLGVGQPRQQSNAATLASGLPPGDREFLLYFPLYNGLSSLEIGVPQGATLGPAPARPEGRRKPLVVYGTSITQGGCASRPGMVHTAILGRRFDRDVINLGFSGNGRMEPELADLLAELDPAVYVLDCLPNMNDKDVTERVEPFVKILRDARPDTPIVLAEDRTYSNAPLLPGTLAKNVANREALKGAYRRLVSAGVTGVSYLPGDSQLGDDGEGTVDGSHPTDLGFLRMADAFEKVLRPLLNDAR